MKKAKTKKGNKNPKANKPASPTLPPKNSKQKRIPRPLGLTLMIKEYNQTSNKEILTRARNMIIELWANNNFYYEGRQTSIDELARYLNTSSLYITKKIVQPMKNWLTNEKVEDRYEALLGLLTKMTLATRSQTQNHIQVMASGQAIDKRTGQHTYTAFVSGEITRAIALIHKSDENFLKIIQEFKPNRPATAIQVNSLQADAKQSPLGNYLGINEAVKLLDANRETQLLDDPDKQAKLLAEHIPQDIPEIIATKQQGISIDGSTKLPNKRDHSQRREADGAIHSDVIIP
jgi:hypothetical protein